MIPRSRTPVTPGEILLEEFLVHWYPATATEKIPESEAQRKWFYAAHLAKDINAVWGYQSKLSSKRYVRDVFDGLYTLTVEDCIVLADTFGNTESFWFNLQVNHLKSKFKKR